MINSNRSMHVMVDLLFPLAQAQNAIYEDSRIRASSDDRLQWLEFLLKQYPSSALGASM